MEQAYDALIIGAGPAGSAAAIELAKAGARVALLDRRPFPRDKVCGDALIPDALNALARLSLKHAVTARARMLNEIRIFAPSARSVSVRGECACVPRAVLDDVIRGEAVSRGAEFLPGFELQAPLVENDTVCGATFATANGRVATIRAGVTILATGAAAEPLKRFEVCDRVGPSATAARLYVRADETAARRFDYLCISYDRTICPGYGWIFPGPDGVFNVGVGYFYDARGRPPVTNVRVLLERFLSTFPPAVELMKRSRPLSTLKGAPLRTALSGAALGRPGLLVVGEAAGSTYSFSGEGIGKALESGIIAAEVIVATAGKESSRSLIPCEYAARIRAAFSARFAGYKLVQDWLSPTMANLVVWRANRSRYVMQQIEGVFQETIDPRQIFSIASAVRLLLSR